MDTAVDLWDAELFGTCIVAGKNCQLSILVSEPESQEFCVPCPALVEISFIHCLMNAILNIICSEVIPTKFNRNNSQFRGFKTAV